MAMHICTKLEPALPRGYTAIAGGYSFARLRVGLIVRAPNGREVYCQPGDDEAAMAANIDSLDEIDGEDKRAIIADMILGGISHDLWRQARLSENRIADPFPVNRALAICQHDNVESDMQGSSAAFSGASSGTNRCCVPSGL